MSRRFSNTLATLIPLFVFTTIIVLGSAHPALAQTCPGNPPNPNCLSNPLGISNINVALGVVIKALLGLAGAAALVMFVWGGVQWLISGGNADRVKSGKQTLLWAALGIVVIFMSYALVSVVVNALAGVPAT